MASGKIKASDSTLDDNEESITIEFGDGIEITGKVVDWYIEAEPCPFCGRKQPCIYVDCCMK